MRKQHLVLAAALFFVLASSFGTRTSRAQQSQSGTPLRVVVDLVQLNVAVTDNKGNYITNLQPSDFVITEDGIPEKIATFEEGNGPTRRLVDMSEEDKPEAGNSSPTLTDVQKGDAAPNLNAALAGADVFILFDTSNYMYRGFVFAQDAISDFIRSLETVDKVAFYSYSRNLSRAASLTADRARVLHAVRTTVAGDDAALYNLSTAEAQIEPVSTAVFERMSAATGGKAYFAKSWRDEKKAFASIRNDLGHLYSISYYPALNPNHRWRAINVKLVGERAKKYHIRTRNGYRPQPIHSSDASVSTSPTESKSLPH